jgi:glycosyltransferase involved in cell wall biosynthesis
MTHSKNSKNVILSMIVKNESKIIIRCLESVCSFISGFVIHDTGSTDNTVSLVTDYFKKHQIKGIVRSESFIDFEHNRNLALREAFRVPNADYILLIDADMCFVCDIGPERFLAYLTKPSYKLVQKGHTLSYHNTRILGKVLFDIAKYQGVTHEFIDLGSYGSENIDCKIAFMNDYADGGTKQLKFVRDRALLEKDVLDNPNNPRSKFYLAQTYRDMNLNQKSIDMYHLYREISNWDEESFYALYMIGRCHTALGQTDLAFMSYMKCWEERPHRAEPLLEMVTICRVNKWYTMGWTLGQIGKKIKFPKNDILFIRRDVYEFRFDYELSILAYHTGNFLEGRKLSNSIMLNRPEGLTNPYLTCVQKNNVFYTTCLPGAIHYPLNPKMSEIGWNWLNPGLMVGSDGDLQINLRCVNYIISGNEDHPKRTRNFQISWKNGKVVGLPSEWTPDSDEKIYKKQCVGLEDMRLFKYNNEKWFCATARHLHKSGINHIYIGNKNGLMLLDSPTPGRCEKNWLPFEHEGDLLMIYSISPLVILKVNTEIGKWSKYIRKPPKKEYMSGFHMTDFMGSGAPVKFGNGYLLVSHEVLPDHNVLKRYFHRFLFMNNNLCITKVSPPFNIRGKPIEYVSGLAVIGSNVFLTSGEMDRLAFLTQIPCTEVLKFLDL